MFNRRDSSLASVVLPDPLVPMTEMRCMGKINSMAIVTKPDKPTADQLIAAKNLTIPDLIARDLRVLFCGINPGLYSAATGHHFAKPGNRFWPALYSGGFTPRLMSPWEEHELLDLQIGITSVVARTTATAAELSDDELRAGAAILRRKVQRYKPRVLAVLGIGAYRTGFGIKSAAIGLQKETIGETKIWILPNPSGLNAHFTPKSLGALFLAFNKLLQ
jgi:TDG/mug DNA glycosylase family protein